MAASSRRCSMAVGSLMRKHSQRALKKLRGHPAVWRHRLGLPKERATPEPLKWSPKPVEIPFHGWVPPSGETPDGVPFVVDRTAKGKSVPVYRDIRHGRTKVYTVLRRYRGDEKVLAEELSKVCYGEPVDIRPGRLQVPGDHKVRVRNWLYGLGF